MRRTHPIPAALTALAATLVVFAALAAGAAAAPRIDPPHPGRSSSGATSVNWAGYSVTSSSGFTSVTATWTQPAVKASEAETYAAFWVGLDGDSGREKDTVEQIGTMGYTSGGHAYYDAWYEMYPAAMQPITKVTVAPGDVVTATVQWTGATSFTLKLTDQTTGKTFTRASTQSNPDFLAPPASAEVIAERPSSATGVLPLARFGIVDFSGCAIDGGTLAAAGAASIDMADDGGPIVAATSALGADGASFTVSDDFTGPTVAATGLQRSALTGWKNSPVTVKLRASDGSNGSGVAAVYYTLDGGATQTYSGSLTISDADSHKIRYWAVDAAGNTGNARTGYVNLDLSAPSSAPQAVNLTRALALRGSVVRVPVAETDPLPTCGTAKVLVRVTTKSGILVAKATRLTVVANRTSVVRVKLPRALKKGAYYLRTRATDAAGNVQAGAGKARLTVE